MQSNLLIRQATVNDLEAITKIYNHYVVETHITFDLEPVSLENRHEWMQGFSNDRHQLLVGELNGRVIGYASSSRFRYKPAYDSSVETTIYLDPAEAGHGHGSVLYTALHDALTKTDIHRAYAVISVPNDASISLHSRFGYTEVGHLTEVGYKFEKYWDTVWMEKRF